jgi:hypothetical protein
LYIYIYYSGWKGGGRRIGYWTTRQKSFVTEKESRGSTDGSATLLMVRQFDTIGLPATFTTVEREKGNGPAASTCPGFNSLARTTTTNIRERAFPAFPLSVFLVSR